MADKIALICGGGALPVEISDHLRRSGRPYCVIRIAGISDPVLNSHIGYDLGLGDFARLFDVLRSESCRSVCMIGYVKRPDFNSMQKDAGGEQVLPSIQTAGKSGDDSLLRQVAAVIEAQGVRIEGAHEVFPELLLGRGLQAGTQPSHHDLEDAQKAIHIASHIGTFDIGQAVVVADGLVLAVEAQEGTQAMLSRIPTLSPNLRGTSEQRKGVLAKVAKPIQDLRLDMPTIGEATIIDAANAGLSGIVAISGALLVVDKAKTYAMAERLGLFIYGLEPEAEGEPSFA